MSGWYIHGKLASQEQEDAELALALAEASSLLYDPHLLDLGPDHFVQVSLHKKLIAYTCMCDLTRPGITEHQTEHNSCF